MKTKKKRSSIQKFSQILVLTQISFSFPRILKLTTKKKVIISKISPNPENRLIFTNSEAISTILRVSGLNLHSGSSVPINFFGAQFSLGRALPRNTPPPVASGLPPRSFSCTNFLLQSCGEQTKRDVELRGKDRSGLFSYGPIFVQTSERSCIKVNTVHYVLQYTYLNKI